MYARVITQTCGYGLTFCSHCMDSLFCIAQLTSRPKMHSQLQPVLPYTMAFIDLELTAVHKVGGYNEHKSHMVVLIIDHAVIQY